MHLACLLSLAATVLGAPSPPLPSVERVEIVAPAPVNDPVVVLTLPRASGGSDDRAARVEGMIRAHVETLPVTLVVEHHAGSSPSLRELLEHAQAQLEAHSGAGMLWVDLGRPGDTITLHVLQREREQVYSRSIDTPSLGEAVALETLANISAMATLALAEGRSVELDEPESDEASEEPAPPELTVEPELEPEPELPLRLHVSGEVIPQAWTRARLRLGYRGQSFAGALPWLSAAELALAWRPDSQAHIELGVELTPAARVELDELGVSLGLVRVPAFVAGGYRFELRRGWGIELAARAGLEPTRRTTTLQPGALVDVDATLPSWRLAATLGADIRASVALRENVRVAFGVGFVAMLMRNDYTLIGVEQPLLSPSPVRLSAGAGLEFDLLPR